MWGDLAGKPASVTSHLTSDYAGFPGESPAVTACSAEAPPAAGPQSQVEDRCTWHQTRTRRPVFTSAASGSVAKVRHPTRVASGFCWPLWPLVVYFLHFIPSDPCGTRLSKGSCHFYPLITVLLFCSLSCLSFQALHVDVSEASGDAVSRHGTVRSAPRAAPKDAPLSRPTLVQASSARGQGG